MSETFTQSKEFMSKKNPPKDNPNAFKHWMNSELLNRMSSAILKVEPRFDDKQFKRCAKDFENLELKPRVRLISKTLNELLPKDFPRALRILVQSTKAGELKGFDLWPYTEFVQSYGLEYPEDSLSALYEFTQIFTAEFAIRPFINSKPEQVLHHLLKLTKDPNPHVRRWTSEGSRPRLPWGEKLHVLIKNPELGLKILEQLKYDDELYVRKSIANHLNDISKDHPDLVIKVLKKWKKESPPKQRDKINWIAHRALRSLIKAGHPKALSLMGVESKVAIRTEALSLKKKRLQIGERLEFTLPIQSVSSKTQKLIVDYRIHFLKASGKSSPKVFKLKTLELRPKEKILIQKAHHLKEITTMVFRSGTHLVDIQINGQIVASHKWTFVV